MQKCLDKWSQTSSDGSGSSRDLLPWKLFTPAEGFMSSRIYNKSDSVIIIINCNNLIFTLSAALNVYSEYVQFDLNQAARWFCWHQTRAAAVSPPPSPDVSASLAKISKPLWLVKLVKCCSCRVGLALERLRRSRCGRGANEEQMSCDSTQARVVLWFINVPQREALRDLMWNVIKSDLTRVRRRSWRFQIKSAKF